MRGKKQRRYRVALAGYYGFGNLGDELLLRASLECLERCGVRRESVVILSNDPGGTSRNFSAAAVSRWSLGELRRALSSSDTLLLGGGGLFQDSTSLRSCLWYYGLVRLACLCGARPWALGQSIGPLGSRAAQRLARGALARCHVLHVRDEPSMEWAGRLGLRAVQGGDLALTLAPPAAPRTASQGSTARLLLNLRPTSAASMTHFAGIAASYINVFDGEVLGVALSREDELLLERIRRDGRLRISRVVLVRDLEEVAPLWSSASAALGMRLHFAVLSALYAVPLAVLPYDPKVAAFGEWAGVPRVTDQRTAPRRPRLPVSQEAIRAEFDNLCRRALEDARAL